MKSTHCPPRCLFQSFSRVWVLLSGFPCSHHRLNLFNYSCSKYILHILATDNHIDGQNPPFWQYRLTPPLIFLCKMLRTSWAPARYIDNVSWYWLPVPTSRTKWDLATTANYVGSCIQCDHILEISSLIELFFFSFQLVFLSSSFIWKQHFMKTQSRIGNPISQHAMWNQFNQKFWHYI